MGAQQNGLPVSPARVWVIAGASRGIGEQYVAQVSLDRITHPMTMSHSTGATPVIICCMRQTRVGYHPTRHEL